ncbi:hypothetical protein IE81DRAFT_137804 [Ceraceosorus guamensis]|uniref:Uncharacterized protein n=1 Tax=Ceraceosorus guamensis TaxID=1522189 RepID=A0A316VZH8_9BASI|nr:hypothetical protein IE81DRAFT_137804 [Ceraceosorus guamensis]PWN42308.1 hypothetical protein IE81DRAFT_137804 [Ceraceosorus guamensis]
MVRRPTSARSKPMCSQFLWHGYIYMLTIAVSAAPRSMPLEQGRPLGLRFHSCLTAP